METRSAFFKKLTLLSLFLVSFIISAQATTTNMLKPKPKSEKDSVYLVVDQMPAFQGGRRGLSAYISQNLKYPLEARRVNAKGKVYIKFVVNAEGHVQDVDLVRKGNPHLDAEALRVVREMPVWKAGKHKGKNVNVSQIVTISFPPK